MPSDTPGGSNNPLDWHVREVQRQEFLDDVRQRRRTASHEGAILLKRQEEILAELLALKRENRSLCAERDHWKQRTRTLVRQNDERPFRVWLRLTVHRLRRKLDRVRNSVTRRP